MSYKVETPFDSIESAHQYLSLLLGAAHEGRDAVAIDLDAAGDSRYERRTAVLRLISYNLEKLEKHVKISRRILNDLRALRRIMLEERTTAVLPTLTGNAGAGSPITSDYA